MQTELGQVSELAERAGKRLATLSINTELRFVSPQQRAKFTEELQQAIVEIVGRYSSPFRNADGSAAEGRPFRLVLGCYPIPPGNEKETEPSTQSRTEKA